MLCFLFQGKTPESIENCIHPYPFSFGINNGWSIQSRGLGEVVWPYGRMVGRIKIFPLFFSLCIKCFETFTKTTLQFRKDLIKKWVWIISQTHIRNTDSHSDTDLENLHIILNNQWFSLIVIKVSQRVANSQFIDKKTSPQKFVILSIIRGASPT